MLYVSIIWCLLLTAGITDAKVSSGKLLLTGENSVHLLTKFAVSAKQTGSFKLNLKIPTSKGMYTDERHLKLSLFNDERRAWSKAKSYPLCWDQVRYAKDSYPVVFNAKDIGGISYWVADIDATLSEYNGDMYWYLTLNDCLLEQSYHSIKDAPEMEYTFVALNGESHVSADEIGMNKLHLFQIFISLGLFLWVFFKIIRAVTSAKGQIHVALLAVACAILCDVLSCVAELIHASVYTINGIGSYTFDCFASHFEAQCDALVALVLLLVGAGWTLPNDVVVTANQNLAMLGTHSWVQKTVSGFRSPFTMIHQLKDGNPAAVLVLIILLLHAGLAQWGRTFDDDFDTYHSLEHRPGRVLMCFRMSLGLIFLIVSASVRNNGRCPGSLQPFLKKFQLVGLSWFLSLPFVSTYVSSVMHPHQRHLALAIGATVVQSSSLASLVWLFTADKDASPYHKMCNIRSDNDSFSSLSAPNGGGKVSSNSNHVWKIGKTKVRLD